MADHFDNKVHKRVMIAVDASIDSEYAFSETIKTLDKENDFLFIIAVSPTVRSIHMKE